MQYLSAWELHFRSQGWIKGQHLVLAKLDSIKKKTYINTLSPISLLVKLMLFACILTFLSKHIYSTPCTFVSVWHSLPPLYPNASSWTDAKTSCFFSSLFIRAKFGWYCKCVCCNTHSVVGSCLIKKSEYFLKVTLWLLLEWPSYCYTAVYIHSFKTEVSKWL